MSGSSEQGGFVFAVVFILVFATLVATIPVGLRGPEEAPQTVIPVDPSMLVNFLENENWTAGDFTGSLFPTSWDYEYELGIWDWIAFTDLDETLFYLGAKVLWWFLWLGGINLVQFTSPIGKNRGDVLTFDEIIADASEGSVLYSLRFSDTGESAGSLIFYWNETLYSDFYDAWSNDEVYLVHGLGIDETAVADIGGLLISLLLLQLPNVPLTVQVLLVAPLWASVAYLLWYIVKESLPFI